MDLARYVVQAVTLEKRPYREVGRGARRLDRLGGQDHAPATRAGGEAAIGPRSRAAHGSTTSTPPEIEDQVGALAQASHRRRPRRRRPDHPLPPQRRRAPRGAFGRHDLADPQRTGLRHPPAPEATKSSWIRFEASSPTSAGKPTSPTGGSPMAPTSRSSTSSTTTPDSALASPGRRASTARRRRRSRTFHDAAAELGLPRQRLLTDNGCHLHRPHTGADAARWKPSCWRCGIAFKHSRPYHPQTCGKVERFHQTLKKWLAKQAPAATIGRLQRQVDAVPPPTTTPNARTEPRTPDTPQQAYERRDKARPSATEDPHRRRHPRPPRPHRHQAASITLRYKAKLHHIGIGREHRGKRVIVLRAGLQVRILTAERGELLRELDLDPNKTYHGTGRPPGPPKGRPLEKRNRATVYDGPTQRS